MAVVGNCIDCSCELVAKHKGWLAKRCDPCKRVEARRNTKAWRQSDTEAYKVQRRKKKTPIEKNRRRYLELEKRYGLTAQEYETMFLFQGGRCKICNGLPTGPGSSSVFPLHVDHCHRTSNVRGLLCSNCNTAIGLIGDDPHRAILISQYLKGES